MRVGQHEFEVSTEPYQGGWRSVAFLPGGKQRASATCGSREEAEMDLARKLKDEFAAPPTFDPTKNYENMSAAEQVVTSMLETDYDEHVKANELVRKWDGAHRTYADLAVLKRKSMEIFKEMGQAIAYERALAHLGLKKADVAHPIYGAQIGATHNYKRSTPMKVCRDKYCELRSFGGEGRTYFDNTKAKLQPMNLEACPGCGGPLEVVQKPTAPSDLRGKLAHHIVGVETRDGRKVWFDEPIPPRHYDWGAEAKPAGPRPPSAT